MANNHRTPPKPVHWDTGPGFCRYCGQPVIDKKGNINLRARWHKTPCLAEFKLIYWPATTRKAVWKRDKGMCAGCGKISSRWHMDHVQPLIEAKGNIDFWRLTNLQTLCEDCHHVKTANEATTRALVRKILKS